MFPIRGTIYYVRYFFSILKSCVLRIHRFFCSQSTVGNKFQWSAKKTPAITSVCPAYCWEPLYAHWVTMRLFSETTCYSPVWIRVNEADSSYEEEQCVTYRCPCQFTRGVLLWISLPDGNLATNSDVVHLSLKNSGSGGKFIATVKPGQPITVGP